jgi:HlyD family secretion protein
MPPLLTRLASRNKLILMLVIILIAAAIWFMTRTRNDHPGLASGNGRLEATEAVVATKIAGRLAEVHVREGHDVKAGQVLARLDAEDLAAQLRAAEATSQQARELALQSRAGVDSAVSQQRLARATLERSQQLVQKGFISSDRLDRDVSALQTADAALASARGRVSEAEAGIAAADARAEALRTNVADTTLRAPTSGRVLYRLAEPGEVLAAGGRVLTLLDLSDVYMSIFLPTEEAGKVALGSPARIVLDALPDSPIPAQVAFVAPRSQFTPKEVETKNEREKFMFRIKVKVDRDWMAQNASLAKPGMPGVAWVMTDPGAAWPPALQLK